MRENNEANMKMTDVNHVISDCILAPPFESNFKNTTEDENFNFPCN